ncbi:type II secretion system F family protein [Sandaracinus amylolyticus]|uniref:Type II/IV secretion system protein TadC, associated with Flp pilus assembly n=1 Tax=Sandaracinus amylolyticus TaxID=927083 RepID=A0A0F6SG96_9BACT|nr:type II secretion system F family protein [Sandaracinus amylolyticus]AKF08309.1 Type II/IV secretion system protein TadC, associated with Flp pilus assembly [Sandaracinus amylolyticus]
MIGVSAFAAVLLFAGGLGLVAGGLATEPVRGPVLLGMRGLRRGELLARGGFLATVDPVVRWLARWTRHLPFAGPRVRLEKSLREAGDWSGYDVDELLALSFLGAVLATTGAAVMVRITDLPGTIVPFAAALGVYLPFQHVSATAARRQREIDRSLPGAVDLIALAMSAGLDFVAAIAQVIATGSKQQEALTEELAYVTRQMSLGVTRRRALDELAARVPIEPVRNFVGAIQQAEEKGTPLADTLKQQAATLRMRRSVQGEEAASRAAVLMMLPLVLVMCSILVVLMAPFVIRGLDAGF